MPSPIKTPTPETIFEQDWRAAQQKFEDTSGWARKAAVVICVPCVLEHPDDTPEGQSERSRIEQETDSIERIVIAAAAPHISALTLQKDALDKELYFTKVERDHFKEELTKFKLIETNLQDSCKRMQSSLAASHERVRELEEGLKPFANLDISSFDALKFEDSRPVFGLNRTQFTAGNVRRARALLKSNPAAT